MQQIRTSVGKEPFLSFCPRLCLSVAKPWTEAEAEPWTEAEAKPWTEAEAKPWTEAEAKPWTEAEAKPWTEAEAKPLFDRNRDILKVQVLFHWSCPYSSLQLTA